MKRFTVLLMVYLLSPHMALAHDGDYHYAGVAGTAPNTDTTWALDDDAAQTVSLFGPMSRHRVDYPMGLRGDRTVRRDRYRIQSQQVKESDAMVGLTAAWDDEESRLGPIRHMG